MAQVTLYVLNFRAFVQFERYFRTEQEAIDYAKSKVCVPFYIYPRTMDETSAAICLKNKY